MMQMKFKISDFVTIWQKYNPLELSTFDPLKGYLDETPELMLARMLGYTLYENDTPQIERLPSMRTVPLKLNNTPL